MLIGKEEEEKKTFFKKFVELVSHYKFLLRLFVAEFLGTFVLVFIGCGAVIITGGDNLVLISVGFVGVVVSIICWFEEISGAHFNPAITIVFTVLRELKPSYAILYIIAQVLGSTSASAMHSLLLPNNLLNQTNYCVTLLGTDSGVTPLKGTILELIYTFILAMTVLLTSNSSHRNSTPFVVGAVIACLILAGSDLTGASMNPARSIGPVIVGNIWKDHYVYWIGPCTGGLLAAFIYHFLFANPTIERVN